MCLAKDISALQPDREGPEQLMRVSGLQRNRHYGEEFLTSIMVMLGAVVLHLHSIHFHMYYKARYSKTLL